jgi:hypothetical protein
MDELLLRSDGEKVIPCAAMAVAMKYLPRCLRSALPKDWSSRSAEFAGAV